MNAMKSLFSFMAVAVLLMSQPSLAHQVHAALTKIEYNPRTNHLEVMHRFELHDAEHAVQEIFGGHADIMSDVETQQRFAQYVAERFGIYAPDDTPLPMTFVGVELEGKHLWVYQETQKPQSLANYQVVHNALRDIWIEQTNLVNVKLDQTINTLTFSDNTEVLKINF